MKSSALWIVAALAATWSVGAAAADMTLTPPPNGGISLKSANGDTALRITPESQVQLPHLPAAGQADTIVCQDNAGILQTCSVEMLAVPGETGAAGPVGPKGDKGDKGDTGEPGAQGEKGEAGEVGAKGETGSQGAEGPQGPVGPKGETGARGETGLQGPTGLRGETGLTGATGPEGPRGLTGADGPRGEQGLQGLIGPRGETGPQGDEGPQGQQGDRGFQGPQGIPGDSVQGVSAIRHGCFNAAGEPTAGGDFAVTPNAKQYAIGFTVAMPNASYSGVIDARATNGRSLAAVVTDATAQGFKLTLGWLAEEEAIQSICFITAL